MNMKELCKHAWLHACPMRMALGQQAVVARESSDSLVVSMDHWFLKGDGQMGRPWESDSPMVMSESAGPTKRAAGGSGLDGLCLLISNSSSFFMVLCFWTSSLVLTPE